MEAETEEVYSDDNKLCTVNITACVKYLLRFYGKFKATRHLLQWIGRQVLYRQTNNKGKTSHLTYLVYLFKGYMIVLGYIAMNSETLVRFLIVKYLCTYIHT